jgi:hypothetical protein
MIGRLHANVPRGVVSFNLGSGIERGFEGPQLNSGKETTEDTENLDQRNDEPKESLAK